MTIKIALNGAGGRMGRAVAEQVAGNDDIQVVFAGEHSGHSSLGQAVAGGDGVVIESSERFAEVDADVLIDFSAPTASLAMAQLCRNKKIGMVIGTTGFTADEIAELKNAGNDIAILHAQNMSVGVNALYEVAAAAAKILNAGRLGGGYDIEVVEAHHRHKKDAPSGTALRLGETLAQATGAGLAADGVFARHGRDCLRGENDIGFSAIRGGDIVGEHRVIFAGAGERIEIMHQSTSRVHYAAGAVRAARFVAAAAAGFYDGMDAVLAQSGQ